MINGGLTAINAAPFKSVTARCAIDGPCAVLSRDEVHQELNAYPEKSPRARAQQACDDVRDGNHCFTDVVKGVQEDLPDVKHTYWWFKDGFADDSYDPARVRSALTVI
jgi:hypothetical protein